MHTSEIFVVIHLAFGMKSTSRDVTRPTNKRVFQLLLLTSGWLNASEAEGLTNELGPSLSRERDWRAREAELGFDVHEVSDGLVCLDALRMRDEALLVALQTDEVSARDPPKATLTIFTTENNFFFFQCEIAILEKWKRGSCKRSLRQTKDDCA